MTKTMTESRSIPFFTFQDEIDATELIKLRLMLKKTHKNLTMLPFFIKAASIAMTEYPIVNSNFNPETDEDGYIKEFVIKRDHNFSIAIDSNFFCIHLFVFRVFSKYVKFLIDFDAIKEIIYI